MIDADELPAPEGASEQFRVDRHHHAAEFARLGLVQTALAPLPVEVVDAYHGNVIADAARLPRLDYLHKVSEGAGYRDPLAAQRVAIFRELDAPTIGGYAWPRSDSSIAVQFANYVEGMKRAGLCESNGELVDGAYACTDWERTYRTSTTAIPDLSWPQILEWTNRMRDTFGARKITYSANWVDHFEQWRQTFPDEPLWYACYNRTLGPKLADQYDADLLQHTSSARVAGFRDPVDASMKRKPGTLTRLANRHPSTPAGVDASPIIVTTPAVVTPPATHQENTAMSLGTISNEETFSHDFGDGNGAGPWPPGAAKWALLFDGEKVTKLHLTPATYVAGGPEERKSAALRDQVPDFAGWRGGSSSSAPFPTLVATTTIAPA